MIPGLKGKVGLTAQDRSLIAARLKDVNKLNAYIKPLVAEKFVFIAALSCDMTLCEKYPRIFPPKPCITR